MLKSSLFSILRWVGSFILSYAIHKLLPLDDWFKHLPNWFNYDVAFWLLVAIIGAFIIFLTYLIPYFVSRPLKIEVQEDSNAYINIENVKGHGLNQGSLQTLRVKIHNTSKKTINNVEVCLNKISGIIKDTEIYTAPDSLSPKLPIYLQYTNTDIGVLQFSASQIRLVNVASFLTAFANCELVIEQVGKKPKPETFISAKTTYEIEIKVTGTGVHPSQQTFEISMIGSRVQIVPHSRQRIFMKRI